ncbi:MAG: hypothetical protein ACYTKD_05030 [Planctomycetota bacterium]|jgi:hypothetical protein
MSETSTRAAKKLETLSRAVNRRRGALQKLRGGRPSGVDERHLRKLVKQAQRRKKKLEKDLERHAVKKPSAPAEAPAAEPPAAEAPAAEAPAAETPPEA